MRVWPLRHLGLKLLSIVIAILLWMAVAGEQTVERVLRVPLELQRFPAELELAGDFPNAVDVRVRGSVGALGRVTPGEIVAVLDLQSAEPGPALFPLAAKDVRAPLGVEVIQVSPATVSMSFVNPAERHAAGGSSGSVRPVERTLHDRPLELRNLPPGLTASATPGQVDVSFSGSRDALVRLAPGDVTPFVDLAGLEAGEYALTVQANVAHAAAVTRVAPSTVQVRITNAR